MGIDNGAADSGAVGVESGVGDVAQAGYGSSRKRWATPRVILSETIIATEGKTPFYNVEGHVTGGTSTSGIS